ncbi:MAG: phenylalanyl-tRNA synthetase beta subunit [Bacteroidetes bacterium]|jgi:phenylalanyl-tRNA synthetase beta chain|nr:phenylalanyl-tRNA synthetase beta subunit [Bacteroidota bacterium]
MKISYNWLKTLINMDLSPEEVSEHLTACGLEVESIETFESLKGGLKGLVVGEVVEKEKHPDADKLSLTKVNIGSGELLSIVCGAPNVAAGQKVIVATIGTMLYPTSGDPFEIKKSKIRGALSEGMLCAEDEIGFGESHAGIMVLEPETAVGMPAADYFKITTDHVFEIGLTPNRGDAASHYGVAIDLAAVLNCKLNEEKYAASLTGIKHLPANDGKMKIEVKVEDAALCPRFSGVCISGIAVKDSPDWLKNALKSIGVRPINNIVDVTNFVIHELGQPLHAYDASKIKGDTIVVRNAKEGELFVTLDETERKLIASDLMVCDATSPMCIAGVFGGLHSGVSSSTSSIFLEAAYFNPASIRRSSKLHGLKTDASFRFERGTDPEMTVNALNRATNLILEIAGGTISSEVTDLYPTPIEPAKVAFSFASANRLIGKEIETATVKTILRSLGIAIVSEGNDALLLSVPARKSDVVREADVTEEVMRVYGYNNIPVSEKTTFSVSFTEKKDLYKTEEIIADYLTANGFTEIMSTSLTKESYFPDTDKNTLVHMLNPLSSDLGLMRPTLLYSGLEAIAWNVNRKQADLKLYEIGRTYHRNTEKEFQYTEQKQIALFVTGKRFRENAYGQNSLADLFTLKSIVEKLLQRFAVSGYTLEEMQTEQLSYGITYTINNKKLCTIGKVAKTALKQTDVSQDVYCAEIYTEVLFKLINPDKLNYKEVPKFPSVRRDLALVLDKSVKYEQVKEIALKTERKLLKEINLFDVYEGEKLGNKKSYAVSFIFQDEQNTLNEKEITKTMDKLIKNYTEQLGAELRG